MNVNAKLLLSASIAAVCLGGAAQPLWAEDSSVPQSNLEEIVVTAEKRAERLQNVPVPVTTINADTLADNGQFRLQDYYSSVPGLNLTTNPVGGAAMVSIRGIATGGTASNPTVGILVDDVPYGSSTGLGGGDSFPDIDPSDLARVEVLRGPQGTLYGTSSLGGLIKFVTVDPSTDAVSGRIQADVNHVENGDGPGYGVRGSVNLPLGDTLAVRASAYARRDSGYIDNPIRGIDGLNWGNAAGGRLSALWRPSDDFSLKLGALYQSSTFKGLNYITVQPGLGDLQQNNLPGSGVVDRNYQVYSATALAKLGGVELTSISSYSINSLFDTYDFTAAFGSFLSPYFGGDGTNQFEHNKTDKFSQELRATGHAGEKFDWLVGGFYTHERSPYEQDLESENSATGAMLGAPVKFNFPTTYDEYAAFTDLTVHFTDRFDVQIGGRESHIKETYNETDTGPAVLAFDGGPSPFVYPETETSDNAFTYLLTPRFVISTDLMVYARIASGYRAGGPNPSASAFGLPLSFQPDKTKNYELGVKGSVPGHALSFDASIYRIDWKNIQLTLGTPNGLAYLANGSEAKSQGIELSVDAKPLKGLTVSAWTAWNQAVLTQDLPPSATVLGTTNDSLPFSSRFSGNVSVEQEFSIASRTTGVLGGSVSYTGERAGVFEPASYQRQVYPAYAKTDLHAGVKYDSWTTSLYVNNLADKRGQLGGIVLPLAFDYIQPRTVGLSLSTQF